MIICIFTVFCLGAVERGAPFKKSHNTQCCKLKYLLSIFSLTFCIVITGKHINTTASMFSSMAKAFVYTHTVDICVNPLLRHHSNLLHVINVGKVSNHLTASVLYENTLKPCLKHVLSLHLLMAWLNGKVNI